MKAFRQTPAPCNDHGRTTLTFFAFVPMTICRWTCCTCWDECMCCRGAGDYRSAPCLVAADAICLAFTEQWMSWFMSDRRREIYDHRLVARARVCVQADRRARSRVFLWIHRTAMLAEAIKKCRRSVKRRRKSRPRCRSRITGGLDYDIPALRP